MYVAGRNTPAPTERLEDANHQYFFICLIFLVRGGFRTGAVTGKVYSLQQHPCSDCTAGGRKTPAFFICPIFKVRGGF